VLIGAAKSPSFAPAKSLSRILHVLTECPVHAGQPWQKGLGSAHGIVARPAAHKQWLGEGLLIDRGAKVAVAEAFTDLLKHEGRGTYVDPNASLAVDAACS
jgi:hypothetical protein